MNSDQWSTELADAIANALIENKPRLNDRILIFSIDCHPWNGFLTLAMLTSSELRQMPFLDDMREMAAWKNYDFASHCKSWQKAKHLSQEMRTAYEGAGADRVAIVDQFLNQCALALRQKIVWDAMRHYDLDPKFRVSVCHPDSRKEYYGTNAC